MLRGVCCQVEFATVLVVLLKETPTDTSFGGDSAIDLFKLVKTGLWHWNTSSINEQDLFSEKKKN